MAIEGSLLAAIHPELRGLQHLPASISIIRHGERMDAAGDLSGLGWRTAEEAGIRLMDEAANSGVHRIRFMSGTVPRTSHTADAMAIGARHRQIQRFGEGSSPIVEQDEPISALSLSSIVAGPQSVFVQRYIERTRGAQDAIEAIPRPIAFLLHLIRKGNLEAAQQQAAGKLLLEWLRLDDQRMTFLNGEVDPGTRSAREGARDQAVLLKQQLSEAMQNLQAGNSVNIINCSHENFVLLWARYFLRQTIKSRRRGQPDRVLEGMDIVEKVGGKIRYLKGVKIHFFADAEGTIVPRARFNNAWYELNMEMIDTLCEEAEDTQPVQAIAS